MAIETRKVPADWQHPTDARGRYIGMFRGEDRERFSDCPNARYMPDWPAAERTHWQMYETVSEGTPISRAHPTPEALASELAHTGVWGGGTRKLWLSIIRETTK